MYEGRPNKSIYWSWSQSYVQDFVEFADFYYSAELGSGATQLDDSEYIFQLQEANIVRSDLDEDEDEDEDEDDTSRARTPIVHDRWSAVFYTYQWDGYFIQRYPPEKTEIF